MGRDLGAVESATSRILFSARTRYFGCVLIKANDADSCLFAPTFRRRLPDKAPWTRSVSPEGGGGHPRRREEGRTEGITLSFQRSGTPPPLPETKSTSAAATASSTVAVTTTIPPPGLGCRRRWQRRLHCHHRQCRRRRRQRYLRNRSRQRFLRRRLHPQCRRHHQCTPV